MELKIERVEILKNTLEPILSFTVSMEYYSDIDIPLSISGCLLSHGKIVSFLQEYQHKDRSDSKYTLSMLTSGDKEREYSSGNRQGWKYEFKLTAPLSAKAIEHIENERHKNPEKNVIFNFEFVVEIMQLPFELEIKDKQRILPKNLAQPFLKIVKDFGHGYCQIKHSDWVNHFAPFLGIGNFILVELEIPDKHAIIKEWSALYDRLYERIKDMEQAIKQGDWTKTMLYARQFYELIKIGDKKPGHEWFEDNLRKLFLADQHSQEGVTNLLNAIHQIFEFISKYIHDKDRKQKLNPRPIPTKEDAYFAFALSIGLLNIIGKKIAK